MTLGIITKIWGRVELTNIFLRYWREIEIPGVETVLVAAVSPGEDEDLHEMDFAGWETAYAPNAPLSDKGNEACRKLGGGVDAVLNLGSDDFCDAQYVWTALQHIRSGVDYIAPHSLYFYDLPTGRCAYYEGRRIGAGRVFSSDLLDRVGWAPFGAGSRPDVDTEKVVGLPHKTIPGNVVVDVKTGENIGDYDTCTRRAEACDPPELIGQIFDVRRAA